LLLAPLAVPLAFTALVVLSPYDPSYKDGLMHADSAWPWVLVLGAVTLFGYVASVLLGVPLIRVLRRMNKLSFWSVVPAAAFLGAVTLVAVVFGIAEYSKSPIWEALAILAGAGALVGVLVSASYCWLAGISGRVPDSPRGQRS